MNVQLRHNHTLQRPIAIFIISFICLVCIHLIILTSACSAQRPSLDNSSRHSLQEEVVSAQVIASTPTNVKQRHTQKAETLFDLYLDEERPYMGGEASISIEKSTEILASHPETTLSLETYCDQRNSVGYGMALSNQRTWQLKEFVNYREIPNSRIVAVSYGKEDLRCREQSSTCWEEQVRVQAAFKYLAISQTKLGCLVRVGILGKKRGIIQYTSTGQSKFLQKIKLAPVHQRRRLRRYVYRSPLNLSHTSGQTQISADK